MGLFSLAPARAEALRRFRRNTWKAIALCAAVRLADTALGLGLLATSATQAGQPAEPAIHLVLVPERQP